MYSSIMNSFVSNKNENIRIDNTTTYKGSSSFIFSTKSPLSTTKSLSSQNFITKNKKNLKYFGKNSEENKKKMGKHKKCKRTASKKSIGSVTKKSSYSTSKIKGSFVGKPSDTVSVNKYSSFINSCKISPNRNKSTERLVKKSHRKLDMNLKKSLYGQRKKSYWGQNSNKGSYPTSNTNTNKKSSKDPTRNVNKMEGFDSNYSAIMDTYSELMAKKRNCLKKNNKKEYSKSFHHHHNHNHQQKKQHHPEKK